MVKHVELQSTASISDYANGILAAGGYDGFLTHYAYPFKFLSKALVDLVGNLPHVVGVATNGTATAVLYWRGTGLNTNFYLNFFDTDGKILPLSPAVAFLANPWNVADSPSNWAHVSVSGNVCAVQIQGSGIYFFDMTTFTQISTAILDTGVLRSINISVFGDLAAVIYLDNTPVFTVKTYQHVSTISPSVLCTYGTIDPANSRSIKLTEYALILGGHNPLLLPLPVGNDRVAIYYVPVCPSRILPDLVLTNPNFTTGDIFGYALDANEGIVVASRISSDSNTNVVFAYPVCGGQVCQTRVELSFHDSLDGSSHFGTDVTAASFRTAYVNDADPNQINNVNNRMIYFHDIFHHLNLV